MADLSFEEYPLSTFPGNVDLIPNMSDVSEDTSILMDTYYNYISQKNYTAASELLASNPNLDAVIFNAEKYNKLKDAILSCQKTFVDNLAQYIAWVAEDYRDEMVNTKVNNAIEADVALKLKIPVTIGKATFDGSESISLAQMNASEVGHAHKKLDITDLKDATQSESGLFSFKDKKKLDGVEEGANKFTYTHPTYVQRAKALYKFSVDVTGHVNVAENMTKEDITSLGIPGEQREVTDLLTSTSSTVALSAKAGKTLKDLVDGKAASSHTHTKDQVGLGKVDNTPDSDKSVLYASTAGNANTATNATNHIANKSNPHSVTKSQVGLGNVSNIKIIVSTSKPSVENGALLFVY